MHKVPQYDEHFHHRNYTLVKYNTHEKKSGKLSLKQWMVEEF